MKKKHIKLRNNNRRMYKLTIQKNYLTGVIGKELKLYGEILHLNKLSFSRLVERKIIRNVS